MGYMNVKTTAERWNTTEYRVTRLCREGRVAEAVQYGRKWMIPEDVEDPGDSRRAVAPEENKLPLPIGVSDFIEASTKFYYVDKTLMIRDFLDARPKVSLFTRPRRFGKTLNMDMLRVFFENTQEDTAVYFKDKKIWNCGEQYRCEQGQYPVIFLTFKDVKFTTWKDTLENIQSVIAKEFIRHHELMESAACEEYYKRYFNSVVDGNITEVGLTEALKNLSYMLDTFYYRPVIVIIDEYDTPIQSGYTNGFYDEVVAFLRNLFSGAFKDNCHLAYGFLTGILRVAKESIFSGLNNLKVHSLLDERYSEYFGFTRAEVQAMLRYYGKTRHMEELREWFDGYLFGKTEIFNPWSTINYIDDNCTPKPFWQATGSNHIIGEILAEATQDIRYQDIRENLQRLMSGGSISVYIDEAVIYPDIRRNSFTVYSFLLMAGYLKVVDRRLLEDGNMICEIAIPNKEIFYVYEKEILSCLSDTFSVSTAISIQTAIITQDVAGLQRHLQDFLKQSISMYDTSRESFYHGLMLGLYAVMNNRYRVTSNQEAGDGRYDIQMLPYNTMLPGILIELKVLHEEVRDDMVEETLRKLSQTALRQINEKHYAQGLKNEGVKRILKIGIAFHKKYVEISHDFEE